MTYSPTRLREALETLGLLLLGAALCGAGEDPSVSARREFDAGRYENARALLGAGVAAEPGDARLYHWLARCDFELGDYAAAVTHAGRSVDLEPRNSAYHQWLGRSLGRKAEKAGWFWAFGLARKARREFEEAVRLDPKNVSAERDLIEFYEQAPGILGGGGDRARRQIETLTALDPVQGHLALGGFWASRKDFPNAELELRWVLEARPRELDPYFEVADFYRDRRDAAHLREAVALAAAIDPSDGRLAYYRGVACVLAGDPGPEGAELLTTYLVTVPDRSDFPSHASAREWLGRLHKLRRPGAAPPSGRDGPPVGDGGAPGRDPGSPDRRIGEARPPRPPAEAPWA